MQTLLSLLFIALAAYLLVSLIRPLPPFRSRKQTLGFGLPLLLLVAGFGGYQMQIAEEEAFQRLKTEDPAAYQAELERRAAEKVALDAQAARSVAERDAKKKAEEEAERQKELCSDDIQAFLAAKEFMKQRLKSPSTADFPFLRDGSQITTLECGHFKVRSFVDAQNSFGAMIRTNYEAVLRHSGGGNWTLEALTTQ